MGIQTTYNGTKYGLFGREVNDKEGNKHQKVQFIELGKEKAEDVALSEVPKSGYNSRLGADRPISISENEEQPPWARIKFEFTDADKAAIAEAKKAEKEAADKADTAKTNKMIKKAIAEDREKYAAEIVAGKHPELIDAIVKGNVMSVLAAVSKLQK